LKDHNGEHVKVLHTTMPGDDGYVKDDHQYTVQGKDDKIYTVRASEVASDKKRDPKEDYETGTDEIQNQEDLRRNKPNPEDPHYARTDPTKPSIFQAGTAPNPEGPVVI